MSEKKEFPDDFLDWTGPIEILAKMMMSHPVTKVKYRVSIQQLQTIFTGGGSGSADGGVLESIAAMDAAAQGKFYGVQLPDVHPELDMDHFALICIRGGANEELVQVAIGWDDVMKIFLRGGEANNYDAFSQISGGGVGAETDPVFAAWLATNPLNDYVQTLFLLRNGRIKSELLPEIASDVVELLDIAAILEDVQGMEAGDKVFYTDDKKIYTYSGAVWENPVTPDVNKLYLCKADTLTYKWNGTTLVTTTSPLPYATLGQVIAGTNTTNLVTPYSAFYAFKNWVQNTSFELLTASKKIIGAINELFQNKADLLDGKHSINQTNDFILKTIEYEDFSNFPVAGENKTIYIAQHDYDESHPAGNYIWDGLSYAFNTDAFEAKVRYQSISQLNTTSKKIIGAINEAKSKYEKESILIVCSDETTDITSSITVPKLHYVFRDNETRILNSVFFDLNTASTGSLFTIDIKKNGTSIFSTLLTIDSGENTSTTAATPYVLNGVVTFSAGDSIDIYVTSVGSSSAGKGLKGTLLTTKQ